MLEESVYLTWNAFFSNPLSKLHCRNALLALLRMSVDRIEPFVMIVRLTSFPTVLCMLLFEVLLLLKFYSSSHIDGHVIAACLILKVPYFNTYYSLNDFYYFEQVVLLKLLVRTSVFLTDITCQTVIQHLKSWYILSEGRGCLVLFF